MTHNYSNISTLQVQSQKLSREPAENPCDKIQLQLETINNQTYIIMEDVNLLKHKLLRGRGDRAMLGARRVLNGFAVGRRSALRDESVTSFARRCKRIIASICSFLF